MDFPFVIRNYTGLCVARAIEMRPSSLTRLKRATGSLKPFIAARLRGSKFHDEVEEQVGEVRMRLRLADDLQRQMYLGLYETDEIDHCRPLVSPGGTCIDVGANIGWISLHMAKWVGPAGRVISCEPDPLVADEFRRNCQIAGVDQTVNIVNKAVGAGTGTAEFIRASREHSGWGSIVPRPENTGNEKFPVEITTLDAIAQQFNLNHVDLLKVDVEGYEFSVFKGARESLARKIYKNIMVEWLGVAHTRAGNTAEEFLALFSEAGYEPHAPTAAILADFRAGRTDPKTAFANFYFRRP